jgi:hypothetical protein
MSINITTSKGKDNNLALFYFLWALATFFHFEWGYLATTSLTLTSLSLLAIIITAPLVVWTLRRDIFLLMIVAQLVDCYQLEPRTPNHWQLVSVINIGYLLMEGATFVSGAPRAVFVRRMIMATTIAFYSFATFWKLTVDFFDPSKSCAVAFSSEIPIFGSLLPSTFLLAIPIATICIEGLIPFLIALGHYRAALLLGITFHFTLALNLPRSFINFSGVMYALLTGSCTTNAFYCRTLFSNVRYRRQLALILLLIIACMLLVPSPTMLYRIVRLMIVGTIAAYICFLALRMENKTDLVSHDATSILCKQATIVPVVLVFIIGISPILGIRNGSSWQMYGNLIFTSQSSNHLLLPPSFNLFKVQGNEVDVTYNDSSRKTTEYLSLIQECAILKCEKIIKSIKKASGNTLSIEKVVDDAKNLSWFKRKIMRLATANEMKGCQW